MNAGKVLLGVFAGLAAGTLLGIFLAPEKGSVTREKIKSEKENTYAGTAKDKLDEFKNNVSEKFEDVKSVVFK